MLKTTMLMTLETNIGSMSSCGKSLQVYGEKTVLSVHISSKRRERDTHGGKTKRRANPIHVSLAVQQRSHRAHIALGTPVTGEVRSAIDGREKTRGCRVQAVSFSIALITISSQMARLSFDFTLTNVFLKTTIGRLRLKIKRRPINSFH